MKLKVTNKTPHTVVGVIRIHGKDGREHHIAPGAIIHIEGPHDEQFPHEDQHMVPHEVICHSNRPSGKWHHVSRGKPLSFGNTVTGIHIRHHEDQAPLKHSLR